MLKHPLIPWESLNLPCRQLPRFKQQHLSSEIEPSIVWFSIFVGDFIQGANPTGWYGELT